MAPRFDIALGRMIQSLGRMLNLGIPDYAPQPARRPGDCRGNTKARNIPVNNKLIITVTVALATVVLGGCASTPWGNGRSSTGADATEFESQKAELARREDALAQQQSQLDAGRAQLADARSEMEAEAAAMQTSGTGNSSGLIPPDPKPGECYARVIIPATYQAVIERVRTRDEGDRIKIIPAKYDIVDEPILIKEASTRLEVVDAQYEIVEEPVMIKPPTIELQVVDAVYETVLERVLVKEATIKTIEVPAAYEDAEEKVLVQEYRTEWKRATDIGTGGSVALASATQTIQRYGDYKVLKTRIEDTGVLMCLVEIPAIYEIIPKKVLVKKASTRTEEITGPAYEMIEKKILKTPAMVRKVEKPAEYRMVEMIREISAETTREFDVPAEYRTVSVRRMVESAGKEPIPIPAKYVMVKTSKKLDKENIEWRPVLCEINMTRENVSVFQSALNGTDSCRCGPNRNACQVDGIIGQCTLQAVQLFAKQKGLSWGNNYITMDVVRALGLTF